MGKIWGLSLQVAAEKEIKVVQFKTVAKCLSCNIRDPARDVKQEGKNCGRNRKLGLRIINIQKTSECIGGN